MLKTSSIKLLLAGLALLCGGAALAVPGSASESNLADQRVLFLEAERALSNRDSTRFEHLSETLQSYPLYPYLRYAELRRDLSTNGRREIEDFLTDYADTPLPNQLRRAWLSTLARGQQWETFQAAYRPSRDSALECYYRRAHLRQNHPISAFKEIEKLWLVGRSQPAACDPLFRAWQTAGGLTPELAWRRATLAVTGKQLRLARYLRRFLSPADKRWLDVWLAVQANPKTIERYPQLRRDHPRAGQIAGYAMARLGLRDELAAADLWKQVKSYPGLNPNQAGAAVRAIALGMATSHRYEAQAWLGRVPAAQRDRTVREWRIRVALRQFDWPGVMAYIGALTLEEQSDLRWRYWRARALEALQQQSEANTIYQTLSGTRHYYGFLSADRLKSDYQMQNQAVTEDRIGITALAQLPAVQRAQELYQLQRLTQARREWHLATRALDEADLQQAARLAQQWGWLDQAIRTLARTSQHNDVGLRFPTAYRELITSYSDQHRINPAWAFAVARKESLFAPDARSRVGALGLMQLMPDTGRRVARSLNTRLKSNRQLLDPGTNVRFGTAYLATLMNRYGHPVLATAAYNAGPHNVDRWLPEQQLPADIWIETISFGETRDYLAGVMAFTAVYQHQLGQPAGLSKLMVNIVKPAQPD